MPTGDSTVYLIRHAEKPYAGVGGVDETGAPDDKSLIARGWRRAGAWAVYFGPSGSLALPQIIYASNDEKEKFGHGEKDGSNSQRPIETVTELSQRLLGKDPDASYAKGQEQQLTAAVSAEAGVTLVCWQHEAIPTIAQLLGPSGPTPSVWPHDRFDLVWRLMRPAGAAKWSFDQICPQLLSGDQAAPISSSPG